MIEESPDPAVVAIEFDCVVTAPRECISVDACWIAGYCMRSRPKTDAKRPARKKDVAAIRRKLLRVRWCYSCEGPASDGHHIIFRSHGGDDIEENIAPLCHTCHQILHAGTGEEREAVCRNIGESMMSADRDAIRYVLKRLGFTEGRSYLERRYFVTLPVEPDPED